MLFNSLAAPLIPPPDDISLPQFILDDVFSHQTKPVRSKETPCLIDEETGQLAMLAELQSRTDVLARAFKDVFRIGDGDVVAIFSPNHIDYPVCVWAIQRLGAIVAAMSPILTADELVHQLRIAKPSTFIAHVDNLGVALDATSSVGMHPERIAVLDGEKASSKLPCVSIDELCHAGSTLSPFFEKKFKPGQGKEKIAFLCFSSGTTGKPKAVALSHYNVMCNVLQTATFNRVNEAYAPWEDRRFRPGDVCTGVLPLYHIYGLVVNLHYLIYSAMTIVITKTFKFETFLRSIARYRITHLMIVPPQAVLLCKHPATMDHDLSTVHYCMVAAAPMTSELTSQLLSVLPNIHLGQGYGMTETCAAVSMFPTSQKVGTLGSAGQLVSGTVGKVVKTDGSLAKVGEAGELWIQGGQVALGYYENEEASRETFVDGWLRTGDEVIFRDNGDLFVTDRIKELIKVKGFQVAPAELEGHLLSHPDVSDAGVVGIADEYAGEVPLAFIALKPQVAGAIAKDQDGAVARAVRDSIFKHVSDAKSSYKWLTGGIEFIEAIPKNGSGKILRRVLRERAKTLRKPVSARL